MKAPSKHRSKVETKDCSQPKIKRSSSKAKKRLILKNLRRIAWISGVVGAFFAGSATEAGKRAGAAAWTHTAGLLTRERIKVTYQPAAPMTISQNQNSPSLTRQYRAPTFLHNDGHSDGTDVKFTVQTNLSCQLGDVQFHTDPLGDEGLMGIVHTKENATQDIWTVARFPKNVTLVMEYDETCTKDIQNEPLHVTLANEKAFDGAEVESKLRRARRQTTAQNGQDDPTTLFAPNSCKRSFSEGISQEPEIAREWSADPAPSLTFGRGIRQSQSSASRPERASIGLKQDVDSVGSVRPARLNYTMPHVSQFGFMTLGYTKIGTDGQGATLKEVTLPPKESLDEIATLNAAPVSTVKVEVKDSTPKVTTVRYTGEPISVNLKDADLRDFFSLIHEVSGLSIVLDAQVKGTVTIALDDIPWDQAVDMVLENNNLVQQTDGAVMRVGTTETFRRQANFQDISPAASKGSPRLVPHNQIALQRDEAYVSHPAREKVDEVLNAAPMTTVKTGVKDSTPQSRTVRYIGEPISVNVKDVDLRDFFRLIHEISGMNVEVDDQVRGTLTIAFDDVPWDQALDAVLKNNNLTQHTDGNVIRVSPVETLRQEAGSSGLFPHNQGVAQQAGVFVSQKQAPLRFPPAKSQCGDDSTNQNDRYTSDQLALAHSRSTAQTLRSASIRLIKPTAQPSSRNIVVTHYSAHASLNSAHENNAPPLTIRLLRSGGAHLTLGGDVVTEENIRDLFDTPNCDMEDPKAALIVKMLRTGGAHLTVATALKTVGGIYNCPYHWNTVEFSKQISGGMDSRP